MQKTTRQVRKLNLSPRPGFEEQPWLLQVTLFVLTAFLAGIIAYNLRFDTPNGWRNGFVWLFVLAITYVAAAFSLNILQSRWLKRGILFSFLLSLILNLGFAIILGFITLFGEDDDPKIADIEPEIKIKRIVEYDMSQTTGDERPKRQFETPVEAGQAELSEENPVSKQVTTNLDVSTKEELSSNVEVTQITPMPKHQRQLVQSVPRFADLQGTISRQSIRVRPDAAKPTNESNPNPQREVLTQIQESPSTIQKTTLEISPKPIDQDEIATSDRIATDHQISRSETELAEPRIASAEPTLPRRVKVAITLPDAAVAAAATESIAQEKENAQTPETTLVQKQATKSPNQQRMIDPILTASKRPNTRRMERVQDLPNTPAIAAVIESNPSRQVLAREPNDVQRELVSNPAHEIHQTENTPKVAARDVTAPQKPSRTIPSQELQPTQPIETHVRLTQSRIAKNDIVRPTPSTTAQALVPRTQVSSATASPLTTTNVEDTSQVSSPTSASEPSLEALAAPTAVSKSVQGITGARSAPNFDGDMEARPSLVRTASTSAKRTNAIQDMEQGPALAPSESPTIKRAVSAAPSPSVSQIAQVVEGNTAAGAKQPKDVDAVSSSLDVKAASNASTATSTAQVGQADVDFGPTRIVTNSGQSRASGGGQPTVNLETAGVEIPRSPSNQPARPSLAATQAEISHSTQGQPASEAIAASVQPSSPEVAQQMTAVAPFSSENSQARELEVTDIPDMQLVDSSRSSASKSESVLAQIQQTVTLGGGSESPSRRPLGKTVRTETFARQLELTGSETSSGAQNSTPLNAQGTITNRVASGAPIRTADDLVGALPDERVFDGKSTGASESSIQRRSASPSESGRLKISDESGNGIPLQRSSITSLPSGAQSQKVTPVRLAGTDAQKSQTPVSSQLAVASDIGPMQQNDNGGLEVRLDAMESVGGMIDDPSTSVGINRRRAIENSENIADVPARFVRQQFGGPLAVALKATVASDAFQRRINRRGVAPAGGRDRPSPKTEEAIELGLVFLSKQQLSDGRWSLNVQGNGTLYPEKERASIQSDTAATGLALLSFLGAGYHHRDDKYQQLVQDALQFLVERQKDTGDLYIAQHAKSNESAWLYSHAIATIALCEAYGMTQDPWLKEPAQKAIRFIEESQNRTHGGWRYTPGISADTSVTGWMMMALQSARLARLKVDLSTLEGIDNWLQSARAGDGVRHEFRYNPFTQLQASHRKPTKTMTAVGLLMSLYAGLDRDQDIMINGADYLLRNLPSMDAVGRDTYYWYYATQVMFHMGEQHWNRWNETLHPLLTKTQIQDGPSAGSWNPILPVQDRWAPHAGRLYVTTLNLLSLEVYYRHLPIYVDTAK